MYNVLPRRNLAIDRWWDAAGDAAPAYLQEGELRARQAERRAVNPLATRDARACTDTRSYTRSYVRLLQKLEIASEFCCRASDRVGSLVGGGW